MRKETKSISVRIVDLWTEIGVRYLKCNPFVVRTVVQRICSLLKIYAFGNVETVVLIASCVTFTTYLEKYNPRK